jgi:hypothetical protein
VNQRRQRIQVRELQEIYRDFAQPLEVGALARKLE